MVSGFFCPEIEKSFFPLKHQNKAENKIYPPKFKRKNFIQAIPY